MGITLSFTLHFTLHIIFNTTAWRCFRACDFLSTIFNKLYCFFFPSGITSEYIDNLLGSKQTGASNTTSAVASAKGATLSQALAQARALPAGRQVLRMIRPAPPKIGTSVTTTASTTPTVTVRAVSTCCYYDFWYKVPFTPWIGFPLDLENLGKWVCIKIIPPLTPLNYLNRLEGRFSNLEYNWNGQFFVQMKIGKFVHMNQNNSEITFVSRTGHEYAAAVHHPCASRRHTTCVPWVDANSHCCATWKQRRSEGYTGLSNFI